jgi:hypothetical protein
MHLQSPTLPQCNGKPPIGKKYREKEFVFKSLLTGAFITIAVGVNLFFLAFLLELIVSLREQQSTQRRTHT